MWLCLLLGQLLTEYNYFHHILPVIYIGKLYKKDPQQHPELKRYLVFLLEKHVSHIDLLSKLKLLEVFTWIFFLFEAFLHSVFAHQQEICTFNKLFSNLLSGLCFTYAIKLVESVVDCFYNIKFNFLWVYQCNKMVGFLIIRVLMVSQVYFMILYLH